MIVLWTAGFCAPCIDCLAGSPKRDAIESTFVSVFARRLSNCHIKASSCASYMRTAVIKSFSLTSQSIIFPGKKEKVSAFSLVSYQRALISLRPAGLDGGRLVMGEKTLASLSRLDSMINKLFWQDAASPYIMWVYQASNLLFLWKPTSTVCGFCWAKLVDFQRLSNELTFSFVISVSLSIHRNPSHSPRG